MAGDRVLAESYYQFAEHYYRIVHDSTDHDRCLAVLGLFEELCERRLAAVDLLLFRSLSLHSDNVLREREQLLEELNAYEQTLQKALGIIREDDPALLIPGHGDATTQKADMVKRYTESLEYIHNLRAALQSGAPFPEAQLWERYGNKRGLAGPHRENVEFVSKELASR